MITHEIALVFAVILTVAAQLLLRKGALKNYGLFGMRSLETVLGYGFFLVVTLLIVYALQGIYLRTLIIWTATTYILVPISGRLFLNERITVKNLVGAAFIVLGIIVYIIP